MYYKAETHVGHLEFYYPCKQNSGKTDVRKDMLQL